MRIRRPAIAIAALCSVATVLAGPPAGPGAPPAPAGTSRGIDLDALSDAATGDRLTLELAGQGQVVAVVDRVTQRVAGRAVFGRIEDDRAGSFSMTLGDGVAAGLVHTAGGSFELRVDAAGDLRLEAVDPARFAPCATTAAYATAGGGGGIAGGNCDDGTLIDVLVVYTPLARAAAGGVAQIENIAQAAVDAANAAYSHSQIGTQLRLVHAEEVDYDESGTYGDHLGRLTSGFDGYMDNVHTLRNLHGADMVDLLVADGENCGIAWLMQSNSPSFQSNAFSVTTWSCAVGNLTFAHELGHNMGCAHDPANAGNGGLYGYSFGYRHPAELFRTVMSYNCPGGCPRISYFSNPDVNYLGQPTGIPIGQPGAAHNAQTVNQTALTIANFRCSDCNGNGAPDLEDLAGGFSADCNGNAIPDECDVAAGTVPDCNGNGVPDSCDLAAGSSTDYDGDAVPDECGCLANFTLDDVVDTTDFLVLLSGWGPCGQPGCVGDVNYDATVDTSDLLLLLSAWGPCP